MSDDLTLPGSIPGLLRRCSPAIHIGLGVRVVVTTPGRNAGVMLRPDSGPLGEMSTVYFNEELALDLSDATGRAHAAWWLAGRLYPSDGPYLAACVLPGCVFGPLRFGLSTISAATGERWRCHDAFESTDTLDPNDQRLLPDGSRWVDAEALRLVCLHIAGLEVPRG